MKSRTAPRNRHMKASGLVLLIALSIAACATSRSPLNDFHCDGADRVHVQGNGTTRPPTAGDTRDVLKPAQISAICRFPSTPSGSWHKAAFDAPLLRWYITFYR